MHWHGALAVAATACLAPLVAACGGPTPAAPRAPAVAIVDREGRPLAMEELVARMSAAEVAIIGEIHGHPEGLALAARLFDEVARRADRAALSLEALERDEQASVDAFVAGDVDEAELARRRGGAPLASGHRAMIETARARQLPVIAANAPRRLARQARVEGFDALRALPAAEQALFVIPDPLPGGGYRARFASAMGADHHRADDARVDAFFRAQALWDATMADSITRAIDRGRAPVVHVAGRFHVEHDGGLLQMVRSARPSTRIHSLVMVEAPGDADRDRADAIAFVGPAPRAPEP